MCPLRFLSATGRRGGGGIVLLEVVLAMALLVLASGVILGSMSACTRSAARLKLQAHAADLVVSLASEVQMGLLQPQSTTGTFAEPDLSQWTWEMRVVSGSELDAALERVELTVRHTPTGLTRSLVQLLPIEPLRSPRPQRDSRQTPRPPQEDES